MATDMLIHSSVVSLFCQLNFFRLSESWIIFISPITELLPHGLKQCTDWEIFAIEKVSFEIKIPWLFCRKFVLLETEYFSFYIKILATRPKLSQRFRFPIKFPHKVLYYTKHLGHFLTLSKSQSFVSYCIGVVQLPN